MLLILRWRERVLQCREVRPHFGDVGPLGGPAAVDTLSWHRVVFRARYGAVSSCRATDSGRKHPCQNATAELACAQREHSAGHGCCAHHGMDIQ